MAPTRLRQLAEQILQAAIQIEDHLETNNLPEPSFNVGMPPVLPLAPEVAAVAQSAIEAADELQSLLAGPMGHILNQLNGVHNLISLQSLNHLRLAQHLPLTPGSTLTFSEAAALTQIDEDSMTRLLRHSISNHFFTEPSPGHVAHNACTALMAQLPHLSDWISVASEDMAPPTAHLLSAIQRWPGSAEPNHTAWNITTGKGEGFFGHLSRDEAHMARFRNAMSLFAFMPGFEPSHVLDPFDWGDASIQHVVDIGGSDGSFARALADRHRTHLQRVVVQDLPDVIASNTQTSPHDSNSIVQFCPHSFFDPQPVPATDCPVNVFFLRMILHDWSDAYCLRILRSLIPALTPGTKILVNDFCVPGPGEASVYQERIARCHDLSMKVMFNGREREDAQWRALFAEADARFGVRERKQSPGSPLALYVLEWEMAAGEDTTTTTRVS